jgi:hypothetical protein
VGPHIIDSFFLDCYGADTCETEPTESSRLWLAESGIDNILFAEESLLLILTLAAEESLLLILTLAAEESLHLMWLILI